MSSKIIDDNLMTLFRIFKLFIGFLMVFGNIKKCVKVLRNSFITIGDKW